MLTVLLISALASYPSSTQQLQLEDGMTTTDVATILGAPDDVENSTCGGDHKPFPCRIWNYRSQPRGKWFAVFFESDKGTWRATAWTTLGR